MADEYDRQQRVVAVYAKRVNEFRLVPLQVCTSQIVQY